MSLTQEELIAQRDEIIAELQGDWQIKKAKGSANGSAFKAALLIFVSTLAFCACTMMVFILKGSFKAEDGTTDVDGMLPVFIGFAVVAAIMVYIGVLVQAMWYRKLNPIVITGSSLVWAKRKGFVPERMDLCRVSQVIGFQGTGSSRLFIGIMNKIGGSLGHALDQGMFYSQGENNTPKFSPSFFEDGDRLINGIQEIATINTKLSEHQEPSA